ncbi:hypothetical protein EGT07_18200 [Herbaspirillum sp. HC18]|nr:hypothetical protein EGT07_18200 [Herbaspirillum sp. HC18]
MRSRVLLEIIAGIESLDLDQSAKTKVKRFIRSVGYANGAVALSKDERIDYARRLLDVGVSRPTARERLMACFEISRRQAYRAINDALNLCQKTPRNGTQKELNIGKEISEGDGDAGSKR